MQKSNARAKGQSEFQVPSDYVLVNSRRFVAIGPAMIKKQPTGMVELFEGYVVSVKWRRKEKQGHQLIVVTDDGGKTIMFTNTIIESALCKLNHEKAEKATEIELQEGVAGCFYRFQYLGEAGSGRNVYHNVAIMRSKSKQLPGNELAEAQKS
jgi:hypothetical protein